MKLSPEILLSAYCQGIFPMAHSDGNIYWYDPNPRAIIPIETFHVPRRLARTIRNSGFEVRVDHDFRAVMEACASAEREGSWISPEMIDAYTMLHQHGFAHSVETWRDGRLVGGLYGVAIRGLFAGESMFTHATDASKVAMVHLIERLRRGGFVLLDSQIITPHTLRLGAIEVSRHEYKRRLAQALQVEATF